MHRRRVYEVCAVALWLLGCTAVCILACFPVCVSCSTPQWEFLLARDFLHLCDSCYFSLSHTQMFYIMTVTRTLCCHTQIANCSIKIHKGLVSLLHIHSQWRTKALSCANRHFSTHQCALLTHFPKSSFSDTVRIQPTYITVEPVKCSSERVKYASQRSRRW